MTSLTTVRHLHRNWCAVRQRQHVQRPIFLRFALPLPQLYDGIGEVDASFRINSVNVTFKTPRQHREAARAFCVGPEKSET